MAAALVNQPVNRAAVADIAENSTVLKTIAALLPGFGLAISIIQQISLNKQIPTSDAPRVIELIKVENDYKAANMINNVITCVVHIVGTSKGILPTGILFGPTGSLVSGCLGLGALFAQNLYHLYLNNRSINEIRSTGRVCHGMIIY